MKKYLLMMITLVGVLLKAQSSLVGLKTYPFEQIDSLQKTEKRPVLVFIHTDWCKYCQTMKNTTFKNESVVRLLNTKFYFIELNAEEKRNIVYNNHRFKYKPTGTTTGTNELAEQLGTVENRQAYPTLCFLNPEHEIIFQYPQYLNANALTTLLRQF